MKDISDAQVCEVVRRCHARGFADGLAHEVLSRETGQPKKVCSRAIERTYKRGYLIVGFACEMAWLSEAGEALLQ